MAFRYLGVLFIAAVVLLWVASSELIQLIFDDASLSFESPLFLTFYSTSLFSVYLLGFLACPSWRAGESNLETGAEESLLPAPGEDDITEGSDGAESSLLSNRPTVSARGGVGSRVKLHTRLALQFAPMWLIANWTFNASLCRSCGTGTSVSNSTLLSASSSVFTFVFSIMFLGDAFSPLKMLCALLNLGGVALLVLNDGSSDDGGSPMLAGDLMAVFSAACMAGYSVQLKRMLPAQQAEAENGEKVVMPMLFGFLGVAAAVICLPLFFAAIALKCKGWSNLELLQELMSRPHIFGALTINGLLGTVLSDLLWARAVVLTSPLVANLGIGFTIPLAFAVDYARGATTSGFKPEFVGGAVMVLVSFVAVNFLEQNGEREAVIQAPHLQQRSTQMQAVPELSEAEPPSLGARLPRPATADDDEPLTVAPNC